MLLFLRSRANVHTRIRAQTVRAIAIWLLVVTSACGQGTLPECFVEFPVYDPKGLRLDGFQITSAKIIEPEHSAGTDLFDVPLEEQPFRVRGNRLYFPRLNLDTVSLYVGLARGEDQSTHKRVALESCQQRESIVFGQAKPLWEEANWLDKVGQLTGCDFTGDWWVRIDPLFGVPPNGASPFGNPYDGFVDATGKFSFSVRYGVRHLMIVGKDADPLKTFAVNLEYSGDSDLGDFDLTDSCPVDSP